VGTARLHLTFPGHLASEPILHRLATEFGLVTNIRRANIEEWGGWVIVEVDGDDDRSRRPSRGSPSGGLGWTGSMSDAHGQCRSTSRPERSRP
jgi:hypothetical protein